MMPKVTIVNAQVGESTVLLTLNTDIVDPNGGAQTLQISLVVSKGDYAIWQQTNPNGTVKDYITSVIKQKYAALAAMAQAVKPYIGNDITW